MVDSITPDAPKVIVAAATESSPLLGSLSPESKSKDSSTLWSEILHLLSSAPLISLGYFLQNSLQLFSILIIGRLGPHELSVAASSFMVATATSWLVAVGGTTALDVLGSQALTNSDDPKIIGVFFQQCIIVVTAIYLIICLPMWYFCSSLLVAVGWEESLALGVQTFLRLLSPFGLGYLYFESCKKFLQCQGIQVPGVAILICISLLNIPANILCVHTFGFGITGGVIATGSLYVLAAVAASLYIYFVNGHQAWGGWTKSCFVGISKFVKLASYGIVAVGAEWWAFEIIALVAGSMGKTALAAQSVVMTTDNFFTLIPFGVGVAVTHRMGNHLGVERFDDAKKAARAASIVAICGGSISTLVIMLTRGLLAQCFTSTTEVIDVAVTVFPWVAGFQIVDGLAAINSGCLRALGLANVCAAVNFIAYYLTAIPLGVVLAIKFDWGLHGLWAGLFIALTLVGTFEVFLVHGVSWKRLGISITDPRRWVEDVETTA